ncbi:MAG: zf-HC2 domain-containing protein [Pseudonocardia sp.]|nr:zf-HC2 domain-containing protein [Pseudonocardia sp.]
MTPPNQPDQDTCGFDPAELSAHVLGLSTPAEAAAVEAHLAECAHCRDEWEDLRAMTRTLDDLPPEALHEGPPDSDLVLHRALRRIRAERHGERRRTGLRRLAVAAAAALVLLGGGAVAGRITAPSEVPQPVTVAAGTRTGQVTQGAVTASATVTPAGNWIRLAATVKGIPQGENCRLIVVAADGTQEIAGGWIVGAVGEGRGVTLDGSAAVAADDVKAVLVQNTAGRTFAEVTL